MSMLKYTLCVTDIHTKWWGLEAATLQDGVDCCKDSSKYPWPWHPSAAASSPQVFNRICEAKWSCKSYLNLFYFCFCKCILVLSLPMKPEGTYGLRSVCQYVSLSHFSGSCDNFIISSYFFMKLETWTDGNMEIMHSNSFCSYVKNCGCYGNKYI